MCEQVIVQFSHVLVSRSKSYHILNIACAIFLPPAEKVFNHDSAMHDLNSAKQNFLTLSSKVVRIEKSLLKCLKKWFFKYHAIPSMDGIVGAFSVEVVLSLA